MGNSPLIAAVDRSDVQKVRMLLADPTIDCEKTSCGGQTAVYIAARRGNVEILRLLLNNPNHRPELNRLAHRGYAPLHIAAAYCHLGCVTALLAAGADPRVRTGQQASPGRLPAAIVGIYASHGQDSNKEHIRAILDHAATLAAQPVALPVTMPVPAPYRHAAPPGVAQAKPPGVSTASPHHGSLPLAQQPQQQSYSAPLQIAASGAVVSGSTYGPYASMPQDPAVRPPAYSA